MDVLRHLTTMSVVAGLTVGTAFTSAALAQEAPMPGEQQQQQTEQPQQQEQTQQTQDELTKASEWVDKPIHDQQGQQLGTLEDLAVDVTNGRVAYGLITFEAGQDLGDGYYAVPWQALQPAAEGESLQLTVSLDQFNEEDSFTQDNLPDMTDEQWARQIHEQFGYQVYWQAEGQQEENGMQFEQPGQQQHEQGQQQGPPGHEQQQQQQEGEQFGQQQEGQQQAQEDQQFGQQAEQRITERLQEHGLSEQEAQQVAQQVMQEARQHIAERLQQRGEGGEGGMIGGAQARTDEAPQRVEPFDQLKGQEVLDTEGESLAEIEDLVIHLREGRIAYGVLSYGGILGMGQKRVAVPWSAIQTGEEETGFVLDTTADTLDEISYTVDDEPDMTDEQWASQVHQTFNQEPYWQVYGYAAPGAGGAGIQQIEQHLNQAMVEAGVDEQSAREAARELAQQFQQEQLEQEQIVQRIQQRLEEAGIDAETAQQKAQELAPQIEQLLQQRPQQQGEQEAGEQEPFEQQPEEQPQQQEEEQPGSVY